MFACWYHDDTASIFSAQQETCIYKQSGSRQFIETLATV